jgi:hypothetical protein
MKGFAVFALHPSNQITRRGTPNYSRVRRIVYDPHAG